MPKLDAALNLLLPKPEVFSNAHFSPEQSITDVRVSEGVDQTLAVVVPPWHASRFVQNRIEARKRAAGHTVIAYSLHDDVLSANADETVKCFAYIGNQIANDVQAFLEIHPKGKVEYTAASLGCAILTYAMGVHNLSGDVDLVVPGGDLAVGLWRGIRTQHLRKAFEAQGVSETDLCERWHVLAPAYQALSIRDSRYRLIISDDDLVIRPDTVKQLAKNLRTSGNYVDVIKNKHLGHFGTILLQHSLENKAQKSARMYGEEKS